MFKINNAKISNLFVRPDASFVLKSQSLLLYPKHKIMLFTEKNVNIFVLVIKYLLISVFMTYHNGFVIKLAKKYVQAFFRGFPLISRNQLQEFLINEERLLPNRGRYIS